MKSDTKTVMFCRPVQISDIDYKIDIPIYLESEEEIKEWIMNNLDKVEQVSSFPDTYTIDEGNPSEWEEWTVSINPALNYIQ